MARDGDVFVRADPFGYGVKAEEIADLFNRFPAVAFHHYRDTLGSIFGSHRRRWLERTQAKLDQAKGLRAEKPNSRKQFSRSRVGRRTVFYRIYPRQTKNKDGSFKRFSSKSGDAPSLSQISGEAFTTSQVALGLEQGGVRKPKKGRALAIPIGVTLDSVGRPKSRWRTPSKYLKASPKNKLLLLALDKGKPPLLYQVRGSGKKALSTAGAVSQAADKGRIGGRRRVLLPAYRLVPQVRTRPVLRFMATWDELEPDRRRRWGRAMDRIMQEV